MTEVILAGAGWEQLRFTRSDPPAAAVVNADRRATYVFALEQAQQMFQAAATAGPATQPLLLFYGLSQAGRAIAAAARAATGDTWRLVGHGVKASHLDRQLAEVTAVAERSGSFVRLAELLGSPLPQGSRLPLAELWDVLPENRAWPLTARPGLRVPLSVDPQWLGQTHPLAMATVSGFPPEVVASGSSGAVRDLLADYPDAAGYDFARASYDPQSAPEWTVYGGGFGQMDMTWPIPKDFPDHNSYLSSTATRYGDALYFFPGIGPHQLVLHPLVSWWAVLYVLSMLARYTPAQWQRHIAVDTSTVAVPLERLLQAAMQTVPKLIMQAIRQVQ